MKTRPAILSITLLSLLLVVVFFFVFKNATGSKNKVLLQNRYTELKKSTNTLIENNNKYFENIVLDNTYDTDLLQAILDKNSNWIVNNLIPTLRSYDIDFIWVIKNNGDIVFGKDADGKNIPFFYADKKLLVKDLENEPSRNFYTNIDSTVTQIVIAPIDLSLVSYSSKLPKVYFACGKKLDATYLKNLSEISTGANFAVADSNIKCQDSVNTQKNTVCYTQNLNNFLGTPLAVLTSTKTLDEITVYSNYMGNYSLMYLAFILLLLFVFYQYLSIKVLKPVHILSEALDKKDGTFLGKIKTRGDEFADMANLIDDSFAKTKKLNQEIELRQQSEKELKIAAINLENATVERIRAEQDRLAKSDFLSTMSHEIRTPINGVIGIANLLRAEKLKASQKELVDTLLFSSNYLLSILTDILDFSKIESGNLTFDNVQFSVNEICKSVLALNTGNAKNKGIGLELEIDEAVADYVSGDSLRLSQMLNNLVGNAIKFTAKGKVKMTYKLLQEKKGRQTIAFSIIDSGIGIDADKLDTIFESFSQADRTIATNYGGTGLGLAITKKLIELQGGSISVTSKINRGTTFKFLLSFDKVDAAVYKVQKNTKKQAEFNLRGLKVLVAEDNKINATILKKFLDKWNVEMDLAINGKEAIEKLAKKDYDLVLMDLHMPVMGGKEATAIIRSNTASSYTAIPIVALTADATTETQQIILASGFNSYITKPFNPDKLYDVLQQYSTSLVS